MKKLKDRILSWFTQKEQPNIISLSKEDIKWIKLFKGHYGGGKTWIDLIKPTFEEIYGWNADEFYESFLDCMFKKLLNLHLRISDDKSGHNIQLVQVFDAAFTKSPYAQSERPIERAISVLCSHIRNTIVIEKGIHRFKLD